MFVKIWGDTIVVTGSLNRADSLFKAGTLLTSINGVSNRDLVHHMLQYLPLDGYSDNVNYIRLSSNFPFYHRSIFGIHNNYRVGYIDSNGIEKTVLLPMYNPLLDTVGKQQRLLRLHKSSHQKIKREKRLGERSLEIDTSARTAILILNTFSNGESRHLHAFMKQSFKKISQQKVSHLIIDLRSNGGGDVPLYVKLSQYIRNTEFKIADTVYAVAKNLAPFSANIKQGFLNNLALFFLTKKILQ